MCVMHKYYKVKLLYLPVDIVYWLCYNEATVTEKENSLSEDAKWIRLRFLMSFSIFYFRLFSTKVTDSLFGEDRLITPIK